MKFNYNYFNQFDGTMSQTHFAFSQLELTNGVVGGLILLCLITDKLKVVMRKGTVLIPKRENN